ncbi:MAG TPA: hypothetical protein VHQ46_05855 [Desulfobacteria bacterium]|nr:hypothetical protein [Desulfobacteria bacterium]
MKMLLKTITGLIVIVIVGSFIVSGNSMSKTLETGQTNATGLVSRARIVTQELQTLTDQTHRDAYINTVKNGLQGVIDLLNQSETPQTAPRTETSHSSDTEYRL